MEFSKCIENVVTAETENGFPLKFCLCSLKGTQLPDAQEGQKGAEGQSGWGIEVQSEELLGDSVPGSAGTFEDVSTGEETILQNTSGSTCPAEHFAV